MKIYHNLGINKLADANPQFGTSGVQYTIESAQIMKKSYGNKNVLQMEFREYGKELGSTFGYGLIGEEVFKPFMAEIGTDSVDALVGKEIIAFIPPLGEIVKGLAVKK